MATEQMYEEYIPINLRGKEYIHSPTLQTVSMVEETLKKLDYYPNKKELKEELPRKVQHQTLNIILNYLESNNKIMYNKGRIVWIWNSELVEKYLKERKELIIK